MRNYPECLLDPEQSAVVIIDHQPQMYFGVQSHPRDAVENNVVGLAKAAQLFAVPCILTTVEAQKFSGYLYSKIQNLYPKVAPIDRTESILGRMQTSKKPSRTQSARKS